MQLLEIIKKYLELFGLMEMIWVNKSYIKIRIIHVLWFRSKLTVWYFNQIRENLLKYNWQIGSNLLLFGVAISSMSTHTNFKNINRQ
jgi:hypothetical protein